MCKCSSRCRINGQYFPVKGGAEAERGKKIKDWSTSTRVKPAQLWLVHVQQHQVEVLRTLRISTWTLSAVMLKDRSVLQFLDLLLLDRVSAERGINKV